MMFIIICVEVNNACRWRFTHHFQHHLIEFHTNANENISIHSGKTSTTDKGNKRCIHASCTYNKNNRFFSFMRTDIIAFLESTARTNYTYDFLLIYNGKGFGLFLHYSLKRTLELASSLGTCLRRQRHKIP